MIRHLRHGAIDKAEWDRRLADRANALWYAQSWVLDLASPGWEALIDDASGAMMPLTCRRKFGVHYLFQPFGLQQLGIFATGPIDEAKCNAFLHAIPSSFRLVEIHGNAGMPRPTIDGWDATACRNRTILRTGTIDEPIPAYSSGHQRNIRSSSGDIVPITIEEFTALFDRTIVKRFGPFDARGLRSLSPLMRGAMDRGQLELRGMRSGTDVIAGTCIMRWAGRDILFKTASDERGREGRAMFRAIDHHLRSITGTGRVFDMAGSNDPDTDRFYAGFGAEASTYFRLRRNLLPTWITRKPEGW